MAKTSLFYLCFLSNAMTFLLTNKRHGNILKWCPLSHMHAYVYPGMYMHAYFAPLMQAINWQFKTQREKHEKNKTWNTNERRWKETLQLMKSTNANQTLPSVSFFRIMPVHRISIGVISHSLSVAIKRQEVWLASSQTGRYRTLGIVQRF